MRERDVHRRPVEFARPPEDEYDAYGQMDYEPVAADLDERLEARGEPMTARRVPFNHMPPKRKRNRALYRTIFWLACIVAVLLVLQETVFRLQTVYVEGNESKTPQQIAETAGLVKGLNIFAVNSEEIRRNLSRDHTIRFVGMQKAYPSTLYLFVEERKAVASFQWNGILYTMDGEGLVMSDSDTLVLPEGMPVVTGFKEIRANVGLFLETKDNRQLQAYKALISEIYLQMYQTQIAEINLNDPENLYLVTVDGTTVRLGNAEYARAKIGAVRTDVAYLRQLGKTRGVLDVSIPEDAKYIPE